MDSNPRTKSVSGISFSLAAKSRKIVFSFLPPYREPRRIVLRPQRRPQDRRRPLPAFTCLAATNRNWLSEGRYTNRQPRAIVYAVADLWEAYVREYRNQDKKDAGRLEIAWNHLRPMFENKAVEEVSTDLVNQYIETRRAAGIQNGTINRETATVRAMFHHGTRVTPPMVDRMPAFPSRLKESAPRKGFHH